MLKLNIGAGDSNLPGFTPIDAKLGHDALKLPYADNTVDEVYASHVLEHIDRTKARDALVEWVRVLKPGGRIRIAVPDLNRILVAYRAGELSEIQVQDWLYGTNDPFNRHNHTYGSETLTTWLRSLAIEDIGPWQSEYEDWSRSVMSLNIQGFKRVVKTTENPTVAMVLSTGRFVPGELMDCAANVCRELGWRLYSFVAPGDWGKGLTDAVYRATADGDPDYIMFLDHDSVFTSDDCRKMVKLMQDHPEYGAMYPVQVHRHMDVPLGFDTLRDPPVDYTKELADVPSGHFGCTIMRTQVLRSIPEPWFMSLPNPETGKWNMKNLDADLFLWAQMSMHGWKIAQANQVQIGHLEWCVKWIKPKGIIWQPIQNYRKLGKPTDAVFDGGYWTNGQWKEQRGVPTKPVETPTPTNGFIGEIEKQRVERLAQQAEVGSLSGAS